MISSLCDQAQALIKVTGSERLMLVSLLAMVRGRQKTQLRSVSQKGRLSRYISNTSMPRHKPHACMQSCSRTWLFLNARHCCTLLTMKPCVIEQRRLLIGGILTVALGAFALVPTDSLRIMKPTKPLFMYLIPLIRIQVPALRTDQKPSSQLAMAIADIFLLY